MISRKAKYIEFSLRRINFKKIVSKMILSPKRNSRYSSPPRKITRKFNIEHFIIDNRSCYSIKSTHNPRKYIIYLHGGAYAIEASKMHWDIIDSILKNVDCMVTYIDYPLLPESTCTNTINMVKNAYKYLSKDASQDIILMGDSAGGGLALSLAQVINNDNITPKPSKLILMSPWLDVSMQDNIAQKIMDSDLILDVEILRIVGKKYAGELDTKNPLCSPLYGDVNGIGEITLFTGTSEILNIQANILKEKVEKTNGKIIFREYENMQHVWVGLFIDEGKEALKEICEIIKNA